MMAEAWKATDKTVEYKNAVIFKKYIYMSELLIL